LTASCALAETTNLPNAKKRKEWRVACEAIKLNGATARLEDFPVAAGAQQRQEERKVEKKPEQKWHLGPKSRGLIQETL
jgi:hypothetical protein